MTQQPIRELSRTRRVGEGARKGSFARFRPSPGRSDSFLATSLELFAERNFASVTIKDIAQALDVNPALIYYYFDSKTDLFRATIERAVVRAFENVRALEDKSADPATILAAWLSNHVNKYHEIHRFVKIALDFRSSHEGDPAIAEAIEAFYVEERRLLSKVIRDGVKQGLFKSVNPARLAQFISTHLDGCMVRSVILTDFDLKGAVRDLHGHILDVLGYMPTKGKKSRRRRT
jgi:TetR/AcrR family transcriptional regulator, upper aerobic nicotinate degradation pathway regulator